LKETPVLEKSRIKGDWGNNLMVDSGAVVKIIIPIILAIRKEV